MAKTKADKWSLTTKDNLKLFADFYPVQDSHKYAITVHGYTSCKEDMFHLPPFPVMNISNITARIICRYNFKEASSLKRLKNAKVPMLFIHGTSDTFVPYAMLDKNIEAYGGPYKEVLRVKGATHGQSVSQDLKLYLSTVQTFLNRWF